LTKAGKAQGPVGSKHPSPEMVPHANAMSAQSHNSSPVKESHLVHEATEDSKMAEDGKSAADRKTNEDVKMTEGNKPSEDIKMTEENNPLEDIRMREDSLTLPENPADS
jgi:hypothetical protein